MSTYEDFINDPRPASANRPEPPPKPNGGEPLFRMKPLIWNRRWVSELGEGHVALEPIYGDEYCARLDRYGLGRTIVTGFFDGASLGQQESIEAAKSACEAHWRARLAEALEPVSVAVCGWCDEGQCHVTSPTGWTMEPCSHCGGSGVEVKP